MRLDKGRDGRVTTQSTTQKLEEPELSGPETWDDGDVYGIPPVHFLFFPYCPPESCQGARGV